MTKALLPLLAFLSLALAHSPEHSNLAYSYPVTVTHQAYDGDTHYYEALLGEVRQLGIITRTYAQVTVRVLGIDTPEMKGANREQGLIVRDYVRSLLENAKEIHVHTDDKRDSFGRLLAEVWVDGLNLSEHLLDIGYAVEFTR